MTSGQKGFTLVELITVLIILGILAAVAIPRFASYTSDARIAALNGLAGAVRSSVAVVQSRYLASGASGTSVTMSDNSTVNVGTAAPSLGIPLSTAGGINNAVVVQGFAYTAGGATGTFNFSPTAITNCFVTYTAATGATAVTSSGC